MVGAYKVSARLPFPSLNHELIEDAPLGLTINPIELGVFAEIVLPKEYDGPNLGISNDANTVEDFAKGLFACSKKLLELNK